MNLNEVREAAKSVLDHNRISCKSLLMLARFAATMLDETSLSGHEIGERTDLMYDQRPYPTARGQLAALRLALGMES